MAAASAAVGTAAFESGNPQGSLRGLQATSQVPPSFNTIAVELGLAPPGPSTQTLTMPPTYDPRLGDACYNEAVTSISHGLCGSSYAHAAALVLGINLCRASAAYSAGPAPLRVSPQYMLALARAATGNGTVCGGGRVGAHVLHPYVALKWAMADRLRRALPMLSCNASADAAELCNGGCAPYVEGSCTLEDPEQAVTRSEGIPDVAVTRCPTSFSMSQCDNSPSGWLDADSFALTQASSRLAASFVSVGQAAGMGLGAVSAGTVGWSPTDVVLMKAWLHEYGAATVVMSACLSWQSWMAGCAFAPAAVDSSAGLCLYREARPGSQFNSTYSAYTIPVNASMRSLPFNGRSCPLDSSLMTVTLLGWTSIAGQEAWIARANWGTAFGDAGDFYLRTSAAGTAAPGSTSGGVALRFPESVAFFPSNTFPTAVPQGAYPVDLPVSYNPYQPPANPAGIRAAGFVPTDDAPFTGGFFDATSTEPALTGMLTRAAFNAIGETQGGAALVQARLNSVACRVIAGGYYCDVSLDVLDLGTGAITRWYAGVVKRMAVSDALAAVVGLGSTIGSTVVSLQVDQQPVTDLSPAQVLASIDAPPLGSTLYTDGEKRGIIAGLAVVGTLLGLLLIGLGVASYGRVKGMIQERRMDAQRRHALEQATASYRDHPSDEEEVAGVGSPAAAAGSAAASGAPSTGAKGKGRAKNLHANVAAVATEADAASLLAVEAELMNGGFGCLPGGKAVAAGSKAKAAKAKADAADKAAADKAAADKAAATAANGKAAAAPAAAAATKPAAAAAVAAKPAAGAKAAAAATPGKAAAAPASAAATAAAPAASGTKAAKAAAAAAGTMSDVLSNDARGGSAPGTDLDGDRKAASPAAAGSAAAAAAATAGAAADEADEDGTGLAGGVLLLANPSSTQIRADKDGIIIYSSKTKRV